MQSENNISCPRCGLEQPRAELCSRCGLALGAATRPKTDEVPLVVLPTIEEEIGRSWEIYKSTALRFYGVSLVALVLLMLVPGVIVGAVALLAIPLPSIFLWAMAGALGSVAAIAVSSWGYCAVLCTVVRRDMEAGAAMRFAWHLFWPFLWLMSIYWFVVPAGFLLFIVPGLVFYVWFFSARYILIEESLGGFAAMFKSRQYAKGYGGEVFLRLLLLFIAYLMASVIPVLGPILFMPFYMIYEYVLYSDLRALKGGDVAFDMSAGRKARWILLATLGWLLPLLIIIGIGAAVMKEAPGTPRLLEKLMEDSLDFEGEMPKAPDAADTPPEKPLEGQVAVSEGNLLGNPSAERGTKFWQAEGYVGTVPGAGMVFYLNDYDDERAAIYQDVELPEHSGGKYLAMAGYMAVDYVSEGSITRLPYIYGYEMDSSGTILGYMQDESMRLDCAARRWQPRSSVTRLAAGAASVRFSMNQAYMRGDDPDGTRAYFDDLELRVFDTMQEAQDFVDWYERTHPEGTREGADSETQGG